MTSAKLGTVLLIDDDGFDQRLYRRIIERSGRVGTLVSQRLAEEALAWLGTEGPRAADVIFLDINMPRMNGFEFLEAAQAMFSGILPPVVIMLTTSLDPRDRARAAAHPAVAGFIEKPLTVAHLDEAARLVHQRDAA